MAKSIFANGILGMNLEDFLKGFEDSEDCPKQIVGQPSRLIPIGKKDDEPALATVFMSALRMVKEFRAMVSEPIGLAKFGTLMCFTEVYFPGMFPELEKKDGGRFDGLAIVVSGNKIKDAAIFEMKQGKNTVEEEQIERYLDMAKVLGIPRVISISNEFVSKPTDYPIQINKPKKCFVDLFHFSWMYIIFLAQILLKKNDVNIADEDQQQIMKEVVRFFEDTQSVSTYDTMNVEKWKDVVVDLASGSSVNTVYKKNREDIIRNWMQEEKSLALRLSLLLSNKEYIQISCDKKKYSSSEERVKEETAILTEDRKIASIFKIDNAVAPLNIEINFQFKTLYASMSVPVPTDKKPSGKLAFVRKYIKKAQMMSSDFSSIEKNVICVVKPKSKKMEVLKRDIKGFMDMDDFVVPKEYEFNNIEIALEYDLGKDIQSPNKFVSDIEDKVCAFYIYLMQYFEKWVPSTPKADSKEFFADNKELILSEEN